MTSRIFESLRVWQDARRLTSQIYVVTRDVPFVHDLGLRSQICRAAVSAMSNIAEGYERGGSKELIHFLRIAKGSVAEVRSQLYAAQDIGYLDEQVARNLREAASSISRQITALSYQVALRLAHSTATQSRED